MMGRFKKTQEQGALNVTLLQVLVLLIAGVFGWSGISKLLSPESFALAVYRFQLLPGWAVNGTALWVGALELTCSICLFFMPRFRLSALCMLFVLMVLFSGAISLNLLQGHEISCGCFSHSPFAKEASWMSIIRNAGLAMLILMAAWREHRASCCDAG